MSLFALFSRRGSSAPAARERLQILLAHERAFPGRPDLLAKLREEILAVVAKHVSVEEQAVQVSMRRTNAVSLLEIDIEIPDAGEEMPRLAGAA